MAKITKLSGFTTAAPRAETQLERTMTVRKRKARRKAVGTRAPILVEARPNAR